jgi:hypothetical protein
MKEYIVEYFWVNGFVERFTCTPNKKASDVWLQNGRQLDSVVRIVITDHSGNVIEDVAKESPYKV